MVCRDPSRAESGSRLGAALEILLGEPHTAATLGANGLAYASELTWGSVMDRYQSFLERVAEG